MRNLIINLLPSSCLLCVSLLDAHARVVAILQTKQKPKTRYLLFLKATVVSNQQRKTP